MVKSPTNMSADGNRKARIAVIGTGWWATTAHLPALAANPNAEIVAICDQRADLLARVVDKFDFRKSYTDYSDLLKQEELDGVVIAVWSAAHFEIARACLAQTPCPGRKAVSPAGGARQGVGRASARAWPRIDRRIPISLLPTSAASARRRAIGRPG